MLNVQNRFVSVTHYTVLSIMKTKQLIKVSTYARESGKSLAWAYKQINTKKVKSKKIDNVIFVIL